MVWLNCRGVGGTAGNIYSDESAQLLRGQNGRWGASVVREIPKIAKRGRWGRQRQSGKNDGQTTISECHF